MIGIKSTWIKRSNASTVREAVSILSGVSADELLHPKDMAPEEIKNITAASETVKQAIEIGNDIYIFGDYDADGITATAILFLMLSKQFGVNPHVRLPKRMSEGYGLSEAAVMEMEPGLLITVDNGIAAMDAIELAKERGMDVVILDHHQPLADGSLPCADVVVDMYAQGQTEGFRDFCGAGLALKLAQTLVQDKPLLAKMTALAAIGTVCDAVPLVGPNRVIVKEGIKAINTGKITKGLKSLLGVCGLTTVDEQSIGFKIGPILNAAGRLMDDGAKYSCGCIAQDSKPVDALAQKLIDVNEQRKTFVNEAFDIAMEQVSSDMTAPVLTCVPEKYDGVVGIVAGKIAEKYDIPTIVFSVSEDDEEAIMKGSGRTGGDVNIKTVLDSLDPALMAGYGGHSGAAGVKVEKKQFPAFKAAIKEALKDYSVTGLESVEYDLEINEAEIPDVAVELEQYAPFGKGNPRPRVLVTGIKPLRDKYSGKNYRTMGHDNEHIRVKGKDFSVVWFGAAAKYETLGDPTVIDVVGELAINRSPYGDAPQIAADDIRRGV